MALTIEIKFKEHRSRSFNESELPREPDEKVIECEFLRKRICGVMVDMILNPV